MTRITRSQFADYIATNDIKSLFIDMGWNNDTSRYAVLIDNTTYTLTAIAQKEGFKIVCCEVAAIPDYQTRRSIDSQFSRQAHEHLIIFVDGHRNQRWLIPVRQADKPTRIVEIAHHHGQDIEALYQRARGLFFNLDEEGNITIVDVIDRVTGQLSQNSEKVTKKFYERFRKEHQSFRTHIHNITDDVHRDWYASLMLNRLMFCYFIQKKRFLDDNPNYLASKLQQSQTIRGSNQFYSFYRDFLLVLFHDGLGGKKSREQVQHELGRIPYLNGGLFDVHELEQRYPDITIDDTAFAQIFGFFDEYDWHLDSNPAASGREVNPDVIGYIFEKYINDRAQMGAYYTKEDITEYIAKNTIIPFLYDETARAGGADIWGEAWELLRASGDTYIYPAVKHGCALELPAHIALGISDVTLRGEWNKPAAAAYANPTEIWREVVTRRQRYTALSATIAEGGITHINDLITHNLNIRQFCQDVLARTTNTQLIRHFYAALHQLTILDPTCGSGAFLFAALNILEPLYAECLNRMEAAVVEQPQTRDDFGTILEDMRSDKHPNQQYYIYKNIILNNLYGVDIMKEATEVAKLRLFLKLVACVDANKGKPNLGIEPLPDIDFNIRAGNALVGFATKQALEDALATTMDGKLMNAEISALSAKVAQDFEEYRELQLSSTNYGLIGRTKANLRSSLSAINAKLNTLLHQAQSGTPYDAWLASHQPFHWYAEFYEIIVGKGGFDVIIGNPPYVVFVSAKSLYQLDESYTTLSCSNLYAFCYERSINISHDFSNLGFIIPNSSVSAQKMESLQFYFKKYQSWISNFAWRPAKLFDGADMLLSIVISHKNLTNSLHSSQYYKWHTDYRHVLFQNIIYTLNSVGYLKGSIPKIPSNLYTSIHAKLFASSPHTTLLNHELPFASDYKFFYFRAVQYWIKVLKEKPISLENDINVETSEMKDFFTNSSDSAHIISSVMSSTLFFIYYIVWSSCQVINSRDLQFPFDISKLDINHLNKLQNLGARLQTNLLSNSVLKTRIYSSRGRKFTMIKQHFYIKKSKSIIDEIDRVLAQHYGFSDEELDYIINYDIKYRMGRAGAEDDDGGEEE
jgi:hypothetical protein